MAWIQDKKEVEVVDLVLRLREKLVNFVSFNEHTLLVLALSYLAICYSLFSHI